MMTVKKISKDFNFIMGIIYIIEIWWPLIFK